MLLEGLTAFIITIVGGLVYSKRKRKKHLFRIDLLTAEGLKIPFSTREGDIEFLQTQLYDIGRDLEKNYFFRDANITEISVIDLQTDKEIFHVILKKDSK
jgi:hypothetical protein